MRYCYRFAPCFGTALAIAHEPVLFCAARSPSEESRGDSCAVRYCLQARRDLAEHFRDREVINSTRNIISGGMVVIPYQQHCIKSLRERHLCRHSVLPSIGSLVCTAVQSYPACGQSRRSKVLRQLTHRQRRSTRHEHYAHVVTRSTGIILTIGDPVVFEDVVRILEHEGLGSEDYRCTAHIIGMSSAAVFGDIERFGAALAVMSGFTYYPSVGSRSVGEDPSVLPLEVIHERVAYNNRKLGRREIERNDIALLRLAACFAEIELVGSLRG